MIINKYNIEKWMFDYFENNLTNHEQIEFERFLEANPQFEEEFEFWKESFNTDVDVPVYEVPESLYQTSIWTKSNVLSLSAVLLLFITGTVWVYTWSGDNKEQLYSTVQLKEMNQLGKKREKALKIELVDNDNRAVQEAELFNQTANKFMSESKKSDNNKGHLIAVVQKEQAVLREKSSEELIQGKKIKSTASILTATSEKTGPNKISFDVVDNKVSTIGQEKSSKLKYKLVKSKKAKYIQKTHKKKTIVDYDYNSNNNRTYAFLEFKRKSNKRRKEGKDSKIKHKERDREYIENVAIISALFDNNKSKMKQKRREKMFKQFRNKEIALLNTHDPIFVINNSNPIDNNLALVGGIGMPRIQSNFSNKWLGSVNEQNTGIITGDAYLNKLNAGVGIEARVGLLDKQNYNTSSVGVTYSQRIQLKEESSLSIGAKYTFDMNNYRGVGEQVNQPFEISQNYVNSLVNVNQGGFSSIGHSFSTALWYDGKFMYGGINLDNIKYIKNENNNVNEFVEYINPFKFAIQLGTDYRRNIYSSWVISPQVNYRYQQEFSELWLGGVLKYKRLITGVGGSFSDAYKLSLGVQGNNLRLIYGFDYSKSKLENRFYGTHEVSIRYLLRGKNNWKK